jgi:hypothetical protein
MRRERATIRRRHQQISPLPRHFDFRGGRELSRRLRTSTSGDAASRGFDNHTIAALGGYPVAIGQPFRLFAARRMSSMCDYSLHHVASRPAKVGDKVTSTTFDNSVTGGFAATGEPDVAVCMRPGTELAFDQDVVYSRGFGLIPPRFGYASVPHRVARFRQVDLDRPYSHHDALEFPNGQVVLVTMLRSGQSATVLQLPADHEHAPTTEAEHRSSETEAAPQAQPIVA